MEIDSQCSKQSKHNNDSIDDYCNNNNETLLPGLPDDLAKRCISSISPSLLFSVCHPWRRLLYSPNSFPPFFSLYALLSPSQNPIKRKRNLGEVSIHRNSIEFFSFDPLSSTWAKLPNPPPPLHILHRHPSFLSRKLPIQSLTVSNQYLVLIAATTHNLSPALSNPLVFHPESNRWFYGPQFSTPRRWCATGSARGVVYMAAGVGSHYRADVAKSIEQWDLNKKSGNWCWENKAQLKDGRFSREAVEAVGYKGKLCMVNVKGNAVKEGAVYDVGLDRWEEMPQGMVAGWNGPATASMDEEAIYVIDEVKGCLSKYDGERIVGRK